jgi:hypothetical protein
MVTFPTVEWIQQNSAINPSGFRHLKTVGFLKNLGTAANEHLNFGSINTTASGDISDTLLVYPRVLSYGEASGIFNMRFFLSGSTAFGAGTYRFLERKTLHFLPSFTLNSSANNTPTIVPTTANYSGTIQTPAWPLGTPWLSGLFDQDVGQYIYLAFEGHVDVPVGTYGGAGAGSYRYRLLYDFS